MTDANQPDQRCADCPPAGYPTDKTRCYGCPLANTYKDATGELVLPTAMKLSTQVNTARIVRSGATVPEICMHNVKLGQGCFCPHCPTARSVGSEAL